MSEVNSPQGLVLERAEVIALDFQEATVRVQGRLPARARLSAKPMLLIEHEGRRFRFPQVAGPARSGQPDGMWTAHFTIPAWLEPQLLERSSLVLGETTLPLPGAEGAPPPSGASPGTPPARADEPRSSRSSRRARQAPATPRAPAVPARDGEEAPPSEPGEALAGMRGLLDELRSLDDELARWQSSLNAG